MRALGRVKYSISYGFNILVAAKRQYLGVDLGGTSIKIGRYDDNGFLISLAEIKTPKPSVPGVVAVSLCEELEKIDPSGEADCVGIALPGPTDSQSRVARTCINLPGWIDVPLAEWVESRTNRKVVLANDGNCALLGESWQGAAKGFDDVILITLGTGVGGAVMIDGELFTGHRGAAAEPGLIGLKSDGPVCNSGNQGSLEQYASAAAIKRDFGCDPIDLFQLAKNGNESALASWRQYGRTLGIGISSLIYMFTPQLILIGGGISSAADYFLPSINVEIEKRVQLVSREGLVLKECQLGNNAGCFGAALLAMEHS